MKTIEQICNIYSKKLLKLYPIKIAIPFKKFIEVCELNEYDFNYAKRYSKNGILKIDLGRLSDIIPNYIEMAGDSEDVEQLEYNFISLVDFLNDLKKWEIK